MRSSESARADSLTITRPDDGHVHLRDGTLLAAVLPHTARQFARAIIMPNLQPPVTTTEQALAYRQRILRTLPEAAEFEAMQEIGLPLLVHGEVTDPSIDLFDREKVFIDQVLHPLRRAFPGLKVVL